MLPMTHTKLAEIEEELVLEAIDAEEMLTAEEARDLVRELARGYELTPEIEIGLLKHMELCQEEELNVDY